MTPPRVVVVGDVMTDVVAVLASPLLHGGDTPARVLSRGGGSAANTAAWLAVSGVPVTLVARVGADAAGDAALAELGAHGVALHAARDPARPTGTCLVLVHPGGERSMLADRGANDALEPADLPSLAGAHLHLSGYTLLAPGSRAAGLAALASARSAGTTVSVDATGAGPLTAARAAAFLDAVAGVDLLLLSEAAAAVVDSAHGAALRRVGAVVRTLGPGGATWTRSAAGSAPVHRPAEAAAVVDTTGAGDAFTAGLLSAWLAGAAPGDALAAGNRLGALAVTRVGARPRPPRRAGGGAA